MSRDWTLLLEDILDACRLVEQFTAGISEKAFGRDVMVFHATVRNLEIIGEATKQLPDDVKARMPEVDWRGAARFRDVIAHRYFALDPAVVWDIVKTKIPGVKQATARLLAEMDQNDFQEGGS